MGYREGLAGRPASARAADAATQVLRGPMDAAAASAGTESRLARSGDHGRGPADSLEAVLVVTHPEQGTKQDGCRNSDKPDSKENQPEGHALPVIAYRELYSMLHQLKATALVSSRTVRRNPARQAVRTLRHRACQSSDPHNKFTTQDWTEPGFWVSSIRRASWTPCSRPREVRDYVPLRSWKGDPASTKRRCFRRFGVSRDCLISPDHPDTPHVGPATNIPVQTPSPRPQPLATSLSRLNAIGPEADGVPYARSRSHA
jgi:hypothetical protein